MKKYYILICLVQLSLLCGFGNAIMVPQNLSDVTLGSDVIVYGKIVNVTSQWNSQKTHIETTAQIKVIDVFASSDKSIGPGSTIPVTVLGGTVGNDTEWVEDTPVFIPNIEVILFLKKTENGNFTVYGRSPGIVPVINGIINYSKSGTSQPGIDVNTYKKEIQSILQGNGGTQKTTIPFQTTVTKTETIPTTKQAPVVFAPVITFVAVMFLFRRHGR